MLTIKRITNVACYIYNLDLDQMRIPPCFHNQTLNEAEQADIINNNFKQWVQLSIDLRASVTKD